METQSRPKVVKGKNEESGSEEHGKSNAGNAMNADPQLDETFLSDTENLPADRGAKKAQDEQHECICSKTDLRGSSRRAAASAREFLRSLAVIHPATHAKNTAPVGHANGTRGIPRTSHSIRGRVTCRLGILVIRFHPTKTNPPHHGSFRRPRLLRDKQEREVIAERPEIEVDSECVSVHRGSHFSLAWRMGRI